MRGSRVSSFKPMLYGVRVILVNLIGVLLLVPAFAQSDTATQAQQIINKAIAAAGGDAWNGFSTLVAHESQARNTENGVLQMEIVHTMDTKGRGYRMDITTSQGKQIYGWDGHRFWADIDGKAGDENQVKEAKRLISDAFYRFSLPFVLNDEGPKIEYAGKDSVNGKATNVVKITYSGGPVDSYWKTAEAEPHGDHGTEKHAAKADEHAGQSASNEESKEDHGGGGHHDGNQVYFFHFDEEDRIVKIYFSHHGDDSYETFLFDDFITIDAITREQSRKLIRADGKTHYDTRFTRVEFSSDSNTDLYKSPHH